MHVALLEQIYANMWKEREYGEAATQIRRERDAQWWEAMKTVDCRKRKLEDGTLVHQRRGPQKNADDLKVAVWGYEWRRLLEECESYDKWRQGTKQFVLDACRCLQLPHPPEFYNKEGHISIDQGRAKCEESRSLDALPLPNKMARDILLEGASGRPQIKFVVYNLAVAGLANGTLAINNDVYAVLICRIRRHIDSVYMDLDYKAGFMDPVDWRAREWNTGADHLANYALATRESGGNLSQQTIQTALRNCVAIQFFTDGGYTREIGGAIGVQCIGYFQYQGEIERRLVGYRYAFIERPLSAFFTELAALETALELVRETRM